MPDRESYPGHPKLLAVAIIAAFALGAALLAAGITALVTREVVVGLLIGLVVGGPMGQVGFKVADHICTERYGEFWIL